MFQKKVSLDDAMFQLKLSAKQLGRLSKKAEKEMNSNKLKVKQAIEMKRIEFAQIYAENAIRKKNESLNFLRLQSRLDAVSSRLKSAQSMQHVTKQMSGVTKAMDAAVSSMDLEKISKVMDKFESQFEDLDVHSKVLEDSIGSATTSTTPISQVDALMKQVADDNGLELILQVDTAPIGQESVAASSEASADADLERRLRAMRN